MSLHVHLIAPFTGGGSCNGVEACPLSLTWPERALSSHERMEACYVGASQSWSVLCPFFLSFFLFSFTQTLFLPISLIRISGLCVRLHVCIPDRQAHSGLFRPYGWSQPRCLRLCPVRITAAFVCIHVHNTCIPKRVLKSVNKVHCSLFSRNFSRTPISELPEGDENCHNWCVDTYAKMVSVYFR